jgi:hypothetical protein
LELSDNRLVSEVVSTRLTQVVTKPKNLSNFRHDCELGAVTIKQLEHATGWLHHEFQGRAVTVSVDLVV